MQVVQQTQDRKQLVINEDRIRTIEVSEEELRQPAELAAYDEFDVAPPPAYGVTRRS